jgi:hypothetical protein
VKQLLDVLDGRPVSLVAAAAELVIHPLEELLPGGDADAGPDHERRAPASDGIDERPGDRVLGHPKPPFSLPV